MICSYHYAKMRHNFHSSLKPDVYIHIFFSYRGKNTNGDFFSSYALVFKCGTNQRKLTSLYKRIQEKKKKTENGPIPIPTKTCTETHKKHMYLYTHAVE